MTSGREMDTKITKKTEHTEIPEDVTDVRKRVREKLNEANLMRARSICNQQQ